MPPSKRYNLRRGGVAVHASDVENNATGPDDDSHEDDMVIDQRDEGSSTVAEKRDRQSYRYKFIDVIEVSVGSQSFQVHRNIMRERSAFFKAAASEAWNAEHPMNHLAEEEPSTFEHYLKCLYHGAAEVNGIEFDYNHHISTYVLAEKLGHPTSCNRIFDKLIEILRKGPLPSLGCVNKTFECLPAGSPLRMLMVDYYVWERDESVLDIKDSEEWWSEFLYAVSQEFLKTLIRNTKNIHAGVFTRQRFNKCHYHQHSMSHPACAGARKATSKNDGMKDWRRG